MDHLIARSASGAVQSLRPRLGHRDWTASGGAIPWIQKSGLARLLQATISGKQIPYELLHALIRKINKISV